MQPSEIWFIRCSVHTCFHFWVEKKSLLFFQCAHQLELLIILSFFPSPSQVSRCWKNAFNSLSRVVQWLCLLISVTVEPGSFKFENVLLCPSLSRFHVNLIPFFKFIVIPLNLNEWEIKTNPLRNEFHCVRRRVWAETNAHQRETGLYSRTLQCCGVQSRMFPTGHLGSWLGGQIEPTVDKTYSGLCY